MERKEFFEVLSFLMAAQLFQQARRGGIHINQRDRFPHPRE